MCPPFVGLSPTTCQRGELPLWNLYDGEKYQKNTIKNGKKMRKLPKHKKILWR
jgi:hypothetical protein